MVGSWTMSLETSGGGPLLFHDNWDQKAKYKSQVHCQGPHTGEGLAHLLKKAEKNQEC